jgi:glucokinase
MDDSRSAAIGIDVGGTDIKGGLVAADGQVIERAARATEVDGGVDHVIGRIAGLIDQLRNHNATSHLNLVGVGLGMPGTLSRKRGLIIAPPNLAGWRNVPVVQRLEALTRLSILLDNDANFAALGEYLCGAGRGGGDMVLLTLGTGIGAGIILDGQLFHGAGENAAEFGHTIVHVGGRRCGCGQLGCLEAYTSARHLIARVIDALDNGAVSSLRATRELAGRIEAADIVEAAQQGDELAESVWQDACRYLAIGCINVHAALDPDRIVFAGGMSNAGDFLLAHVRRAAETLSSPMLGPLPELRIAELGNDAGFIGAALGVFQELPE